MKKSAAAGSVCVAENVLLPMKLWKPHLMVVKKDGSIEPFNREKLLNGLLRACEKRPVSLKALEQIVDQIEQKLKNALEGEASSRRIGELALEQLRQVDQVAYVRFASVYREFQDIDSFLQELKKMQQEQLSH